MLIELTVTAIPAHFVSPCFAFFRFVSFSFVLIFVLGSAFYSTLAAFAVLHLPAAFVLPKRTRTNCSCCSSSSILLLLLLF